MASILSGFLTVLKIAMAVNDGFHSMLSSIYSIIENILSSDRMEPVQETDYTPVVHSSKSRILEAFNRRRSTLPISEQTEVYVSNMNPYQKITITNKVYDAKRKQSVSFVKKSPSKDGENPLNRHDARGNEDICSSCPQNSQCSTPSLISSDTGNESEYQACKTLNCSVELEENIVNICVEDEPCNKNTVLATSIDDEKTSTKADLSPNSSFLKFLQSQIKFINQNLQRPVSNVKSPSTKNVNGLPDSESTDNKQSASVKVCPGSSPGLSEEKQFSEETASLYGKFLHKFDHNKNSNLRETPNERRLKTEACVSIEKEPTLENSSYAIMSLPTCHPATSPWQMNENESQESHQKPNHLPSITKYDFSSGSTDSDSTEDGYLSDSNQVSKRPATKRNITYELPLSLQKDRWIEMEDFEQSKIEDSEKLYQIADSLKRNALIPGEQTDTNQLLVDGESRAEISSSEDGNIISVDILEECQSPIKCNLSRHSFNLKDDNFSNESDVVSSQRVELLIRVPQDGFENFSNVDDHHPQKSMLNILSEVESSSPEKYAAEETRIISAPIQTELWDEDYIPLKELDTEEKQITYLEKLNENLTKCIENMVSKKKSVQEIEKELLDGVEERHEIMLDTITNSYKNQLDSIAKNAGMCLNEPSSIDSDLKLQFGISNFKQETSSPENCLEEWTSLQTLTSVGEIEASKFSFLIPRKFTTEPFLVENEHMSETSLKNELNSLLETKNNSGAIFTLDSERNETSTPVRERDEEIDDHIWVSINLSSVSQDENSANEGKDLISSSLDSKLRRNILGNDQEQALLDSRQERLFSENVKEDSIEAEDWRNLESQMSKNYENVVSLLNTMDDCENVNLKKECESKLSENDDSNVKADMIDSEKVLNYDCASKTHTKSSKTSTEDSNLNDESNSDNLTTSNEILSCDLWNSFSNATATVEHEELEKECLRKENFLNENASSETLEEQMEIHNYPEPYLNSTDNNTEDQNYLNLQRIFLNRGS